MQLTLRNLIREDDGTTNMPVLKAMTRRRAMADYGCISPHSLRQAIRYYGSILEQLQCAWKMRHGVEVAVTMVTAFGKQQDGVRYSDF